jgi:hypothetical protein
VSDKNLEYWIVIKFHVKIFKSTTETLALLTVAYCEHAMKKSSVFNCIGGWRKGEKMCKMQEMGNQNANDRRKCGQSTNLGVLRLGSRLIAGELNMNMETVRQIIN